MRKDNKEENPLQALGAHSAKSGEYPEGLGEVHKCEKALSVALSRANEVTRAHESAYLIHRLIVAKECPFFDGYHLPTIERVIEFLIPDYNRRVEGIGLPTVKEPQGLMDAIKELDELMEGRW